MCREIYLVRHGQIDYGSEKCYIGITDFKLNEAGTQQVKELKKYFADINIDKAYTSPLKRCIETADIILEGSNADRIILDGLMEINMGSWEGLTMNYVKSNFSELYEKRGEYIDTFAPPGGESFKQLQERAVKAFKYITENVEGNAVIVSHAGVNRVILCWLLDIPLKYMFKIKQPYGCINKLSYDGISHTWKLIQSVT